MLGREGFMKMSQYRRNQLNSYGRDRRIRKGATVQFMGRTCNVLTSGVDTGGETGLQKQQRFSDFHISNSSINIPWPHPPNYQTVSKQKRHNQNHFRLQFPN